MNVIIKYIKSTPIKIKLKRVFHEKTPQEIYVYHNQNPENTEYPTQVHKTKNPDERTTSNKADRETRKI